MLCPPREAPGWSGARPAGKSSLFARSRAAAFTYNERTEQTVSASREKKTRQDEVAQGPTSREQKRQQEAREARRSKILYSVVGVVCAVFAVAVIVWNSGVLPRTLTAATINGEKYTAVDLQYYFNTTRTTFLDYYYNMTGSLPFDYTASTKDQVRDEETGQTWYDYLLEQAVNTMSVNAALADKAQAEGYTMSQESQEALDNHLKELETSWVGTYTNRDAYLRANYGSYITYNRYVELRTRDVLANDYATSIQESFAYSDEDYETYYQENADALDVYTVSQFMFQASVDTTDEDGNTIEMTDEEKAEALAEAQAEVKPVAEELQARLEAGEDPNALAEEYADQLYASTISGKVASSSLNSLYSDWVKDSARQSGDVTLVESEGSTTSTYYYVVRFEGRQRDDGKTADVRHILIKAEVSDGAEEPTEEQYAAALEKAEELLDQWKSGEATEESFIELAKANSEDPAVSTNEGLYSNISMASSYVQPFLDWALADHQPGDTGIVRSDDTQGYHIMYYVASGDPTWKQTADSALRLEDYAAWEEEISSGYEAVTGAGMSFISG